MAFEARLTLPHRGFLGVRPDVDGDANEAEDWADKGEAGIVCMVASLITVGFSFRGVYLGNDYED